MVVGIIVDTFSELRDESTFRANQLKDETFIAGITNDALDGTPITMDDIQNKHQDMWNYLHFAIYVTSKDPSECNGVESYVLNCIVNEDGTWFPKKTCLQLENLTAIGLLKAKEEEVSQNSLILDKLNAIEGKYLKKLEEFEAMAERIKSIEGALTSLQE